jgi:hypothetical protein
MCCGLYFFSKTANRVMMVLALLFCMFGGIISIFTGINCYTDTFLNLYSPYLSTNLASLSFLIGIIAGGAACIASIFGILIVTNF